jgi:hypothetical protein
VKQFETQLGNKSLQLADTTEMLRMHMAQRILKEKNPMFVITKTKQTPFTLKSIKIKIANTPKLHNLISV